MFNHIQTSIIGNHSVKQDAIKYIEDNETIIAVVADGLGSKKHSDKGARLICRLVGKDLKIQRPPLTCEEVVSHKRWVEYLKAKKFDPNDFCSTCSFVIIDKTQRNISVGQIGDSPVFLKLDKEPIVELKPEKEFSNTTEALGSSDIQFRLWNYRYKESANIMITTDGIGDELDSGALDHMFTYLSETYKHLSPQYRSRRFRKEIMSTIGNVNSDDKSIIYIWSI